MTAPRTPFGRLEAEGVVFRDGLAEGAQPLRAADLAALLGMDTAEPAPAPTTPEGVDSEVGRRFVEQLRQAHPDTADAVLAVLSAWERDGGWMAFGKSAETSCFLSTYAGAADDDIPWPMTIYSQTGTVGVVFQHMRRRPVFDEYRRRDELRRRLNGPGIDIPESKHGLRPSFRLDALTDPATRTRVEAALEWSALAVRSENKRASMYMYRDADEVGFA